MDHSTKLTYRHNWLVRSAPSNVFGLRQFYLCRYISICTIVSFMASRLELIFRNHHKTWNNNVGSYDTRMLKADIKLTKLWRNDMIMSGDDSQQFDWPQFAMSFLNLDVNSRFSTNNWLETSGFRLHMTVTHFLRCRIWYDAYAGAWFSVV